MESSKRTRVVLLAREKSAIRNYYEELRNKQKSDNNGKKITNLC
jgi:hypothetical protein